jgi:antibiotic biosynthesis monooxygenase (ABM) superfamily enzyme
VSASATQKVLTTAAAWLVAFLVVMTLLTLFGEELQSLPLPLRALVMSGVLVILMANLVMPVLGPAIARRMSRPLSRRPNGRTRRCWKATSARQSPG